MSITGASWDPSAISQLRSTLMTTKHSTKEDSFFPSHSYARGGIGVLISTGSARAGISCLQQRVKAMAAGRSLQVTNTSASSASPTSQSPYAASISAERPATTGSTRYCNSLRRSQGNSLLGTGSLAAAAAASAVLGAASTGVPIVAKREWECSVAHPRDFVSTARQTRVADVRPASRWAPLSLYENDPREVKRHLDINNMLDQSHEEAVLHQLHDSQVRHRTWAIQQRETFRRQRHEAALRYSQAGLPQRKAYSALPASRAHLDLGMDTQMAMQECFNTSLTKSLHSTTHQQRLLESTALRLSTGRLSDMGRVGGSAPVTPRLPKPSYPEVYPKPAKKDEELMETSVYVTRKQDEAAAEIKNQMKNMDHFEQQLEAVTGHTLHDS